MHLGLISNEYPPALHGGIGSCNLDLAEGLVAAGHRVTVIGVYDARRMSVSKETCEEQKGVQVVRLPDSRSRLPYRLQTWWDRWRVRQRLKREHERHPFDLVEIADYEGWLPWGGPRGVPTVVRLNGSNLYFDTELGRPGNPLEHRLEAQSLKRARIWIGASRYTLDRTRELCRIQPAVEQVIHNAVDTELFSPGPAHQVEPGLILFVNSIRPKKGVAELIQAANLVLPHHAQARLVLIGQEAPPKPGVPSYQKCLETQIAPEIRSRVVFAGRMNRLGGVQSWLRKANVCCYPSHAEAFAIGPLEAMATGRPTVFARTGAGPEAIEDGVSGLLCDPKDPKDIAQKLRQVLENRDYAERLGRAGRQRVIECFDKAKWVPENIVFFTKCVSNDRIR